jgi:hypothetical protein
VVDPDKPMSFLEFTSRPGVANAMTRMIAGCDISDDTVIADKTTLEKAISRLTGFAFIGLQEHYQESVRLLYKRMNSSVGPPRDEFRSFGRGQYMVPQIPEGELKQIQESNSLDIQLYSEAKALFYKRLCDSGIACYSK